MKKIKIICYCVFIVLLILGCLVIVGNKKVFGEYFVTNQLELSLTKLYNGSQDSDVKKVKDVNESTTSLVLETIPESNYLVGVIKSNTTLDVKSQPSYSGVILGTISNNDRVSILYDIEDWTKIQSGNVIGYVESKYVLQGDEAQEILEDTCSTFVKSKVSMLRLYSSPEESSQVITLLSNNVEYPMYKEESGYYKLAVDSDLTGYVKESDAKVIKKYSEAKSNEEIQLAKEKEAQLLADAQNAYSALVAVQNRTHTSTEIEDATRTAMVSFAKQYLGNPYLWGGTSLTDGIDCSAYVRAIYDHVGIHLTRTTREQIKQGREITIQEVKPGDLFFYAYSDGYVHHVAMYIGNGELIHAAGKDYGIIISPVDYREPYKIKTYLN